MVGCCGSVVVIRLQGVYNQRRPCDDSGGAKGGDGRDEREATAETKGRRRQRRKGGNGRDEREATAETKGRRRQRRKGGDGRDEREATAETKGRRRLGHSLVLATV